jgi:hypothetical protein
MRRPPVMDAKRLDGVRFKASVELTNIEKSPLA